MSGDRETAGILKEIPESFGNERKFLKIHLCNTMTGTGGFNKLSPI
jgi:hypothetical protein